MYRPILLAAAILAACFMSPPRAVAQQDIQRDFRTPPLDARPMTWWHWMNGNITKEGITADLEAMKRIGLGGAQIFNVAQGEPAGPIKFMSPEWRALTQHAIAEANRLGLKLAIHNCAGWSESGGPWITPAESMQKVVWTETNIHGGGHVSEMLQQPQTVRDYYQDTATIAFPTLPGDGVDTAQAVVTTSEGATVSAALLTGTTPSSVSMAVPAGRPQYLQVAFHEPVTCASLRITCQGGNAPAAGRVEASDDGRVFRTLAPLAISTGRGFSGGAASFPLTRARVFRIAITRAGRNARRVTVTGVGFGSMRMDQIAARIGMVPNPRLTFSKGEWPAAMTIARDRIIDLTSHLQPGGKLDWDAPAGEWTVVRFGHTSTGQQNAPAPDSGRGLECDKMNRAAVEAHFAGMMEKVIADAGPLAGKSLKFVLADSWEAGTQNWTPAFPAEFRKRTGYDLIPWLPTLTGRVVGSLDQSERVLWDFRRTIATLIAENHYALIHDLCAKHGMQLTAEAPGIGIPTIADEIQCKGQTDMPMGEFWLDGHNDSKEAATSAHVYGKRRASAESFTAVTRDARWMKAPYDHKAIGDLNFCRGINLFVFHRYAMQPWLDRYPGMTMGPWGTNFERTNTWWNQSRAWMQYLSRCEALLQDGLFVADACYYYGEGAPNTIVTERRALTPPLPDGYDYDCCDTDVLLTRMKVENGRIVLPDGMSYRVLVLPDSDRMTLPVLRKVRDLVQAGATVLGPKPSHAPSLAGYPACDTEIKRIADEVWGSDSGDAEISHKLGSGRVVWGVPIEKVLAGLGAPPDVETPADSDIVWIHRHTPDAEIYFVSNQDPFDSTVRVTFRAGDRRPELWNPDNGTTESAAQFTARDGRVTVPLHFDPAGSVFVVFRRPAAGIDPVVAVRHNGRDLAAEAPAPAPGALVIDRAIYGADPEHAQQSVDVTRRVAAMVRGGRLRIQADNSITGDPAVNIPKQMRVEYTLDGTKHIVTVEENSFIDLPARTDRAADTPSEPPPPAISLTGDRGYTLQVAESGSYVLRTASGKSLTTEVRDLPSPLVVTGSWDVRFPPKWGAPSHITLDKLVSWTASPDEGVRHFSGTAVYTRDLNIPAGLLNAPGRSVQLDLGVVKEVAEVWLNGKELGILWKPPFRVDITKAAHAGANRLEVRITNLWPNRMIGDLDLPPDKRYTWSTFQPFKAGDPLLDSGLLGPVTLMPEQARTLK